MLFVISTSVELLGSREESDRGGSSYHRDALSAFLPVFLGTTSSAKATRHHDAVTKPYEVQRGFKAFNV
jgi:hypothetical protein